MKLLAAALLLLSLRASARAEAKVEIEGRARQPGEALLVVVTGADPGRAPTGAFQGRDLRFFPGAERGSSLAFVGLDLEISTGPHPLTLSLPEPGGGSVGWGTTIDVSSKTFPTRTLTVDAKYVAPPRAERRRAEREAKLIAAAMKRSASRRYFDGSFAPPIPGAPSSRFGERSVFNGVPKAPHAGADLRAKTGVKVRAPQGGKVVLVGSFFYQGNCVYVDHGFGVMSVYFHLSKVYVKKGQRVRKGQLLGLVGATGRATGPHLHWGVRVAGARVDPFSLTALDLTRRLSSSKSHESLTARP